MDNQILTPEEEALRAKLQERERWEDEKIASVSKQYNAPKVIMIKVPVDETYQEFTYGFIRYPARTDVSIAMSLQNSDPLRGKEIVLRNSWLEGDTRLLDDDELFLRTCTSLDKTLSVLQAVVKKNWTIGQ